MLRMYKEIPLGSGISQVQVPCDMRSVRGWWLFEKMSALKHCFVSRYIEPRCSFVLNQTVSAAMARELLVQISG